MVWRTVSRDRGQCGGKCGRVSGFAPMVIIYIIMLYYRNLYKVSAYFCENSITERKTDNAYVIGIYVFIFIDLSDYSFILSYFCRKTA